MKKARPVCAQDSPLSFNNENEFFLPRPKQGLLKPYQKTPDIPNKLRFATEFSSVNTRVREANSPQDARKWLSPVKDDDSYI